MTLLCAPDPLALPLAGVEAAAPLVQGAPRALEDAIREVLQVAAAAQSDSDPAFARSVRDRTLASLSPIAAGAATVRAVSARGATGSRSAAVIERVLDNAPGGDHAAAALFDRLLLRSAPLSAVRARRVFLARELSFRYRMRDLTRPFRVLALGAGPDPEVVAFLRHARTDGAAVAVTLVDPDPDALERASRRLRSAGAGRVEAVCADPVAISGDGDGSEVGRHDFVQIAHQLDFLPDELASRVLAYGYRRLARGGELVAGHLHHDLSPADRALLEWWLEWYPYYRAPREVGALVTTAGLEGGRAVGLVRGPNVYVILQRD